MRKGKGSGVTRVARNICIMLDSHSFLLFSISFSELMSFSTLLFVFLCISLLQIPFCSPLISILLCWSVSPSVHCLNSLFSHSPPSYRFLFSHLADHHYCGENSCQENPDSLPCGGPKIGADSLLKKKKGDV